MPSPPPPSLLTATAPSPRTLQLLLRCIAFTRTAVVRILPSGLRFTTDQGSSMEAFVLLPTALFTSYKYTEPALASSQDSGDPPVPCFEINLPALLETLNILALSDVSSAPSSNDKNAFRTNRYANTTNTNNPFASSLLTQTGTCTFTYESAGQPLNLVLTDAGVTTTCALTTYEPHSSTEPIPFRRDVLALKTIMRTSCLLDAVNELGTLTPETVLLTAWAASNKPNKPNTDGGGLRFEAQGSTGEVAVEFLAPSAETDETTMLETFSCSPAGVEVEVRFAALREVRGALGAGRKVSVRVDGEGVLSLQVLVETSGGGGGDGGSGEGGGVAFLDFVVVPLAREEGGGGEGTGSESE